MSINQLESLDQWRRKDANAGNDQADESSPAPKTNIADLIMRSTAPERKQAPSAPSLSTPTSSNHRMGKKLSPADLGQLVFVAKAHATEDYDPVGEENAISFRKGEVIDVVSKVLLVVISNGFYFLIDDKTKRARMDGGRASSRVTMARFTTRLWRWQGALLARRLTKRQCRRRPPWISVATRVPRRRPTCPCPRRR